MRSGIRGFFVIIGLALSMPTLVSVSIGTPATAHAAQREVTKATKRSGVSVERLRRQIMDAIAVARLTGAEVEISIRDCKTDKELILIQPDLAEQRSLIPASNLKLISSGVALLALGNDFEFRTNIVLSGNRLIIQGAGDPALADPVLLDKLGVSTEQFINTIVQSIVNTKVERIDEIILDDRIFDGEQVHPDWPTDQLNRAYCAPVCGLNFHANVLNVYASPGDKIGDCANVRTDPGAAWLEVDRRGVRTVAQGNTELSILHGSTPTRFILRGSVHGAITKPVQITLKDPGLIFGQLLADGLKARGIGGRSGADGKPTFANVRYAEANENLLMTEGSHRVVTSISTPIATVLEQCNVESENLYAECLLKMAANKLTGQPGSWSNGTATVRMMLKDRLGAEDAASLQMTDGSGLSRNNRVTASLLTRWMSEVARDRSCGETFVESLAKAGEEGTVKNRFKTSHLKSDVRAKSGYIREVRTLSGFLTDPTSKQRLAFSILINDVPPGGDQRAKDMHEKVVELLDDYLISNAQSEPMQERAGR